jgi:hypothetical protein
MSFIAVQRRVTAGPRLMIFYSSTWHADVGTWARLGRITAKCSRLHGVEFGVESLIDAVRLLCAKGIGIRNVVIRAYSSGTGNYRRLQQRQHVQEASYRLRVLD